MKKLILFYGMFIVLLASALIYQGCSELDTSVTLAPEIRTHAEGWSNPSSGNFHGVYIAANKWNLSGCKTCHGGDYSGGTSGSSCLGCHTNSNGPENCRTCHGNSEHANPPRALNGDTLTTSLGVGVHMSHRYSSYGAALTCEDCHRDINGFDDPNHIGPDPDGHAEIFFGPRAYDTLGGPVRPNPTWDRNTATCSSVYCHGTFKEGNVNAAGIWTDQGSVYCGTCHGDPNEGNPTPQNNGVFTAPHFSFMTAQSCYICHGSVIDGQGNFIDKELHINGEVNY
jgi:predicted CxxxxCH...CXXCH cytochrome family protein